MNFLLSVDKSDYGDSIINTKGFLETLGFGAKMLLIGMVTVFAVLALLYLLLTLFRLVSESASSPHKRVSEDAPVLQPVTPVPQAAVSTADDAELVAVLAAAIAAAEGENAGAKFRVVSFRRK